MKYENWARFVCRQENLMPTIGQRYLWPKFSILSHKYDCPSSFFTAKRSSLGGRSRAGR